MRLVKIIRIHILVHDHKICVTLPKAAAATAASDEEKADEEEEAAEEKGSDAESSSDDDDDDDDDVQIHIGEIKTTPATAAG